jgi:hypothetical protein
MTIIHNGFNSSIVRLTLKKHFKYDINEIKVYKSLRGIITRKARKFIYFRNQDASHQGVEDSCALTIVPYIIQIEPYFDHNKLDSRFGSFLVDILLFLAVVNYVPVNENKKMIQMVTNFKFVFSYIIIGKRHLLTLEDTIIVGESRYIIREISLRIC